MQSGRLLQSMLARASGFNQRVWIGLIGIVSMLLLSGTSALWTLYDIEQSRSRTSTLAVPALTIANEAQIGLLKLARLTANAFAEEDPDSLARYREQIELTTASFEKKLEELHKVTRDGHQLQGRVKAIHAAYRDNQRHTRTMLESRQRSIRLSREVSDEAGALKSALDDLGQAYVDIQNFRAPTEHRQDALDASVALSGVDIYLNGLNRLVDEAIRSTRADQLDGFMDQATGDLLSTSMMFESNVVPELEVMDTASLIENAREASRVVAGRIRDSEGFVSSKLQHIKQLDRASQAMAEANTTMTLAVEQLDGLINDSQVTFDSLEADLEHSLMVGTTKIGLFTAGLTVAAWMMFMSMLRVIRRRLKDLETLHNIADTLAESKSREDALHHVMDALSRKTGVSSGSVFMLNEAAQLEFTCGYPKLTDEAQLPRPFEIGEGIMGHVAREKKARFVPDTKLDPQHTGSNDKPGRALLSVPLVDRDSLIGVMNLSGNVKDIHFSEGDYSFVTTVAHSLVTTLKNLSMLNVIEEQNRTLEDKVASRTEQLLEAQQRLVASEKMAALGVFTAGMAHEINNPANFVSVGIQNAEAQLHTLERFIHSLLDEQASEEDIAPFREHFSRIRDSHLTVREGVQRIESVISKLRANHPEGHAGKTRTNVVELLEYAWTMVQPTITRPVKVVKQLDGDATVECSIGEMHQAFIAVLSNAGHALEDMTISKGAQQQAVLTLRSSCQDSQVVIEVEDNGIGIQPDMLGKIFDPFFTTKEVGRGAGLGLSMVRKIVQDHGGDVSVQSRVNEGTRLTITLQSVA